MMRPGDRDYRAKRSQFDRGEPRRSGESGPWESSGFKSNRGVHREPKSCPDSELSRRSRWGWQEPSPSTYNRQGAQDPDGVPSHAGGAGRRGHQGKEDQIAHSEELLSSCPNPNLPRTSRWECHEPSPSTHNRKDFKAGNPDGISLPVEKEDPSLKRRRDQQMEDHITHNKELFQSYPDPKLSRRTGQELHEVTPFAHNPKGPHDKEPDELPLRMEEEDFRLARRGATLHNEKQIIHDKGPLSNKMDEPTRKKTTEVSCDDLSGVNRSEALKLRVKEILRKHPESFSHKIQQPVERSKLPRQEKANLSEEPHPLKVRVMKLMKRRSDAFSPEVREKDVPLACRTPPVKQDKRAEEGFKRLIGVLNKGADANLKHIIQDDPPPSSSQDQSTKEQKNAKLMERLIRLLEKKANLVTNKTTSDATPTRPSKNPSSSPNKDDDTSSKKEIPLAEPVPHHSSSSSIEEDKVEKGFERFLSVLNKGVDINFLSKVVMESKDDLPEIQPPVQESKFEPKSEDLLPSCSKIGYAEPKIPTPSRELSGLEGIIVEKGEKLSCKRTKKEETLFSETTKNFDLFLSEITKKDEKFFNETRKEEKLFSERMKKYGMLCNERTRKDEELLSKRIEKNDTPSSEKTKKDELLLSEKIKKDKMLFSERTKKDENLCSEALNSDLEYSPEWKKKPDSKEGPLLDGKYEKLQNILSTLGLDLAAEDVSKAAGRTQERLYGRKSEDRTRDSSRETEGSKTQRNRARSRSCSSSSSASSSSCSSSSSSYSSSSSSSSSKSRSPSHCSHRKHSKHKKRSKHRRSRKLRKKASMKNKSDAAAEVPPYLHPAAFPDYSLYQYSFYNGNNTAANQYNSFPQSYGYPYAYNPYWPYQQYGLVDSTLANPSYCLGNPDSSLSEDQTSLASSFENQANERQLQFNPHSQFNLQPQISGQKTLAQELIAFKRKMKKQKQKEKKREKIADGNEKEASPTVSSTAGTSRRWEEETPPLMGNRRKGFLKEIELISSDTVINEKLQPKEEERRATTEKTDLDTTTTSSSISSLKEKTPPTEEEVRANLRKTLQAFNLKAKNFQQLYDPRVMQQDNSMNLELS